MPVLAARRGFGWTKVLVVLAVVAAVGYGCYRYIFGGMRTQGAAGNVVTRFDPNAFEDGNYGDWAVAAPATSATPAEPAVAADSIDKIGELGTATDTASAMLKETPKFDVSELTKIFASVSGTLEKISDVESAKAALPELESMDKQLESATSGFSAMPEAVRAMATSAIKNSAADLEATLEKVLAIPAVKEVLQPVVDNIMAKIRPVTS